MCICGVIIKFVVVHLNITDAFSFARYFHQLRFVSFCLASKFFFVLFSLRCACIAQILLLRRPNSVLSFEMSIVCIKYIRWFFVCFFSSLFGSANSMSICWCVFVIVTKDYQSHVFANFLFVAAETWFHQNLLKLCIIRSKILWIIYTEMIIPGHFFPNIQI